MVMPENHRRGECEVRPYQSPGLADAGDRDALDAGTLRRLQAQNKAHDEIVELDGVVDLAPLVRLRRRALSVRRDEASARIEQAQLYAGRADVDRDRGQHRRALTSCLWKD